MISVSRELAFRILMEVEAGGFAADLLAQYSASLDSRDAGLAAAIALGSLRYRPQLDYAIRQLTGKPAAKLDLPVREALRIGMFQLRYLDRVPPHAAVSESVELVKRSGKRSAAGLVNAVLRKAAAFVPCWPDRSTALCCPEFLLARWTCAFGADAADALALAALETPKRYAHIPPGSAAPDGASPTEIPGCYELPSPAALPPEGRWQDIGSQAVALLLDVEPGHRVLDLCAAPGNKTAQLRESGACVVACDLSAKRLEMVPAPRVILDARAALPFPIAGFDRVLVDAPCSGTGTLGHNPEIKWRITEADFTRQAERQKLILRQALDVLKPGGLLVYSTCSLEPDENERVVEAVAPERVVRTHRRMPGRDSGDGFFAALLR